MDASSYAGGRSAPHWKDFTVDEDSDHVLGWGRVKQPVVRFEHGKKAYVIIQEEHPEDEDSSEAGFHSTTRGKIKKWTKPAVKEQEKLKQSVKKKKVVPGNGNFAKATKRRVKGRDGIPDDEIEEFDDTKVTEIQYQLREQGNRITGTKVDLWNRLMGRDVEQVPQAGSSNIADKMHIVKPKMPGNGNFSRSSKARAVGRDKIPEGDLEKFDNFKVDELKTILMDKGLPASGRKIDLWHMWKESQNDTESDDEDGSETEDEGSEYEPGSTKCDGKRKIIIKNKQSVHQSEDEFEERRNQDEQEGRYPSIKRKNNTDPDFNINKRIKFDAGIGHWGYPPIKKGLKDSGKPLNDINPTDYYIRETFLDMTISAVLKVKSDIFDGVTRPLDNEITFREHLHNNPEHRQRLAEAHDRGESPFHSQEEEGWNAVLQNGFMHEFFMNVMDRTPALWQLWEDELFNGHHDTWRNRWTPNRDVFSPHMVGGRPFSVIIAQWPGFAQLVENGIQSGNLTVTNTDDRVHLQQILQRWTNEQTSIIPDKSVDQGSVPGIHGR